MRLVVTLGFSVDRTFLHGGASPSLQPRLSWLTQPTTGTALEAAAVLAMAETAPAIPC